MARRLPSQPPVLPGFTYVRVLGSGGFADVFLYEQNMPRRQVAVKVLLSEVVDERVRRMFQAEANVMAQLSAHPSILTVFQASVSGDGRPFIAMEYCSARLNDRYRAERMPVAEVLGIAVKIGSALETAHRAGVLHRDIKPSNILLTAYGHPVLSDFGIASTLGGAAGDEAVGMSIPWTAPEVLADEVPGSVASEVWAFAATVYTLLAGRSPFEEPGGSNKPGELVSRIARGKPKAIGREDVPPELEALLLGAMARKPHARPPSVMALVHALQQIETGLGLPATPVEVVMDDWAAQTPSSLEDRTIIRGGPLPAVPAAGRGGNRRRASRRDTAVEGGTIVKTGSLARSIESNLRSTPKSSRLVLVLAGAATAVVVMGASALALGVHVDDAAEEVPRVESISAESVDDGVEFSWLDPGLLPGDVYQLTASGQDAGRQGRRTFTVEVDPGQRACLTVTVNRGGVLGAPSPEMCEDFAQ